MITFAEYKRAAQSFGSSLEGRDEWLILSEVDRCRDSDHLAESNHAAALETLGGESDTVEVWRFAHWAVGWVEHIAVHPSRRDDAQAIVDRMDDYPVLDENDFSEREHKAACEWWEQHQARDFATALQDEYEISDSTWEYLVKHASWVHYVFENEAPYVLSTEGADIHARLERIESRDVLAKLLRKLSAEVKRYAAENTEL